MQMEALMEKIALVTDITADLMEETIKEFDIHVVPLKVSFGDEEFYANQLTGEEFIGVYQMRRAPKTSQPSPEDLEHFTQIAKTDEIISCTISLAIWDGKCCNLAKNLEREIHVQTQTVSLALGLRCLMLHQERSKCSTNY